MLQNLSNNEFEKFKETVEIKDFRKPSHMTELSEKYWSEIRDRFYNFDRHDNIEIEQLSSLKKADLLALFKVRNLNTSVKLYG